MTLPRRKCAAQWQREQAEPESRVFPAAVGDECAAAGRAALAIGGRQCQRAGDIRFRDGSQTNGIPVDEAIEKIVGAIAAHTLVNTAEDLA